MKIVKYCPITYIIYNYMIIKKGKQGKNKAIKCTFHALLFS